MANHGDPVEENAPVTGRLALRDRFLTESTEPDERAATPRFVGPSSFRALWGLLLALCVVLATLVALLLGRVL